MIRFDPSHSQRFERKDKGNVTKYLKKQPIENLLIIPLRVPLILLIFGNVDRNCKFPGAIRDEKMSSKKASAGSARRPTVKSNAQTPRIKVNPHAFMEFEVSNGVVEEDGKLSGEEKFLGRVVFELYEEKLPKTVQNFKSLCLGDKGKTKPVKELNNAIVNLHYKGTNIHRIVKGFVIQVIILLLIFIQLSEF